MNLASTYKKKGEENTMKVVILAGGFGTRIGEETHLKPKPMITIGEMPIIWHIMKRYSSYGYNDFVICCGYKANMIKEYFSNYYLHHADMTIDFANGGNMEIHKVIAEPWRVTLIDTGLNTMTGGRIKRVQRYIGDEPFMLTYGDGVSDVNIQQLVEFHKRKGKIATLTAVQPGGRFGVLSIEDDATITSFQEKNKEDGGWINGGFMVLEPEVFDYIDDDSTVFEQKPLKTLAKERKLSAFHHTGFWQCMDTIREKQYLEELWEKEKAPWRNW